MAAAVVSWIRARAVCLAGALAAVSLALGSAAPAAAQDPSGPPAAAERSPDELRLLEKLRSIGPLIVPLAAADSGDSTFLRAAGPVAGDSAGAGAGMVKAAQPGAAADSAARVAALKGTPGGAARAASPDTGAVADSAAALARARGAGARARALRAGVGGPGADSLGPGPRGSDPPVLDPVARLGEAGENDPVLATLLALDGYAVTEYTGQGARFAADSGFVELVGKAELARDGQRMTADSLLVFDQQASTVCGYGAPVLSGTGNPVTSDQVCYDVEDRLGVAMGARTKFSQQGEWFIHGEEVFTSGDDRLYGANTNFTSCDLEEPHYHFAAGEVKVVHESVMVARDVTLNFGDVPVFWLPFMVQSIKQGRRSGLLAPRFGINDIARTDSDYSRHISNVGFYWAINDFLGAQAALDWFSGNYTALDGQVQFNWARQFLRGSFALRKYWPVDRPSTFTVRGNGSWQASERTSVNVAGTYASQGAADFINENAFDPRELNRDLTANAQLSHRFDWGMLSLGARRQQSLLNGRVSSTFPGANLSLSPVTLFGAPVDDASWYNNMTWTGRAAFNTRTTGIAELTTAPSARSRRDVDANMSSGLNIGRFSWSQGATFSDQVLDPKPMVVDTLSAPGIDGGELQVDTSEALPGERVRTIDWNTGLSYQQRLIGTSTLTPSLSIRGSLREDSLTSGRLLSSPLRIDFGATLGTDLYGFWPGVGPFSRIRHRLSPSIRYSYSPAPSAVSALQDSVFGLDLEQVNQLSLSLNQTFEAKYESDDSVAADTAAIETAPGELRRLPQARKIKLLSLTTSAIAYDFERADRQGLDGSFWDGVVQTTITNSVSSDLIPGISLKFAHDLFDVRPVPGASDADGSTVTQARHFAPHLRSVNTSFTLNSDSWLFQALGLAPSEEEVEEDPAAADSLAADSLASDSLSRYGPEPGLGLVGREREEEDRWEGGGAGSWNARFDYSLQRPRDAVADQVLRADLSFQPTRNWSVTWSTRYSFTEGEFGYHALRLSRDLHRWTANFDFTKAQNGNFLFQFFVQLKDNPDLQFDYHQRGGTAWRR